jgi:phosphatidylserine decarboxylase
MDSHKIEETRINNRLPVAREGIPFIVPGLIITILFIAFGFFFIGIFFLILTLFTIFFFRDPERRNAIRKNAVLTPADGRILNVWEIDDNNPLGVPAKKISIFMSIFNVHVNRAPANGRILSIAYHPGKFFSANLDKASEQNESNSITMETGKGGKIVVVQIAGMIARRIVCWIKEKEYVKAGQRFGLIRFGSRLDVYLPAASEVIVRSGDRVKAGETIIGYLK